MSTQLDHLVVAAATLEQGVRWCESTLGVTPGPGGRHPLMGTHNRLLSIAGPRFPLAYLEIIAVDAAAAAPPRRRWFGLDDTWLQQRLSEGPRLVHAVARSSALDSQRAGLLGAGLDPGVPLAAARETPEGPLRWRILVRDDGVLCCAGALPTLIEWNGRHPAASMPPSGLTLSALALAGVPMAARQVLQLDGVDFVDAASAPALRAVLHTPGGTVVLHSENPEGPTP